jgi:hypothetical protein
MGKLPNIVDVLLVSSHLSTTLDDSNLLKGRPDPAPTAGIFFAELVSAGGRKACSNPL